MLKASLGPQRASYFPSWQGQSEKKARIPQRERSPSLRSAARACICSFVVVITTIAPLGAQEPTQADECPRMDAKVQGLLQAMSRNSADIDYSGVVTLQRGGDMQIMRYSHSVSAGRATEAISRLTGQDARIVREAHPTARKYPGHELLRAEKAASGTLCGLTDHYRFRVSAGDRIAGRDSVRLQVEPMDMYRYGYVLELDNENTLMLRSTTLSVDQREIEQFQFASFDLNPGKEEQAAVEHRAANPHPQESSHLRAGPAWSVSWMPKGFMATDSAPPDSARKSYTDGFASFSVFMEPLNAAIKPGEGVERQGSTVCYTRGMVFDRVPVLLTVLGEIPTNTARMVADSVRMR
ncbi:MAG: MucB/RseB C-terminal domain-containing protein [Pseudomonadota bacterium]